MMYRTEVIRQAGALLDIVDADGNDVIHTRFNDKEKRIEIWSMLADKERSFASVPYAKEQDEASPESHLPARSKPDRDSKVSIDGSLIPVLLRALEGLIEESQDIMGCSFSFDAEQEELRVQNKEDINILTFPY